LKNRRYKILNNKYHSANKKRWDAAAKAWAKGADSRGLWERCPEEPWLGLGTKVLEYLGNISGKQVCVLGSGDNQAVFALAGLGAHVTSVDISQNQLDIAQKRAEELGLKIAFQQADVLDLSVFKNNSFYIVYTGGHVAPWVSDLEIYYSEAVRILKPKGIFIVDEYHPFRLIWEYSEDDLIIENSYLDRGPFEYSLTEYILSREQGEYTSYEFHWTVSDYINAVLKTGSKIQVFEEYGENVADWERAPFHGLPESILIISEKKG
jgi:ubiquinone/menaquinone biosynthesis C-methylase UbiE